MPAATPRRQDTVELIYNNLRQVLRGGIRPAWLSRCPELLVLATQDRTLVEQDPYQSAVAVQQLLESALARLGDGVQGRAARLLFGAVSDSRGRLLKDRRRLAADEFDVLPSTFRRNYEHDIVLDLAAETYLILSQHFIDIPLDG